MMEITVEVENESIGYVRYYKLLKKEMIIFAERKPVSHQ